MLINSVGIIGIGNDPLVHGVMSDDTNQILFTNCRCSSIGNTLTQLTRCESAIAPLGAGAAAINPVSEPSGC